MARVTVETVDQIARLAHLSLTPEESITFARQLDEILAYADSLQALDTARVPPMSHAWTSEVFREDEPREGLPGHRALEAAPDASDGLFRVPRVIG
ncbi:MAG: Asp-tRNA(Asn)/Glu-tRNA(Gln) amidotransferase subunit GatC [Acidobacteria bacterium]|nr:Asp-tRNA(Asn)/Glu-tRNA(Gln) amidotransferase subunit GatC [Acidobacteriota bacterium]